MRCCGATTLPSLLLSLREGSQDRDKLRFFSQDESVLFYLFHSALSREKLFEYPNDTLDYTREWFFLDRMGRSSICWGSFPS